MSRDDLAHMVEHGCTIIETYVQEYISMQTIGSRYRRKVPGHAIKIWKVLDNYKNNIAEVSRTQAMEIVWLQCLKIQHDKRISEDL